MSAEIIWNPGKRARRSSVNLHHQVAARIGSLIAQGKLAPGVVLPNESALGVKFGVSRTALREAIKVLATKGLVEARRKTGTRVRPKAEWNMLDPEVLSWLFSGPGIPAGLTDLLEVRRLVEPQGARMAAERATPEEIKDIEAAFQAMEDAADDPATSIEPDLLFHLAVLEGTHNAFMRPFGALIQAALRASFELTNYNSAAYRRSLTFHRAVLEAIQAGKAERAEAAMLAVLTRTSKDIAAELQSRAKSDERTVRQRHVHPRKEQA